MVTGRRPIEIPMDQGLACARRINGTSLKRARLVSHTATTDFVPAESQLDQDVEEWDESGPQCHAGRRNELVRLAICRHRRSDWQSSRLLNMECPHPPANGGTLNRTVFAALCARSISRDDSGNTVRQVSHSGTHRPSEMGMEVPPGCKASVRMTTSNPKPARRFDVQPGRGTTRKLALRVPPPG